MTATINGEPVVTGTATALLDDFVNGILARVDRYIYRGLPSLACDKATYSRISDDREGLELGVTRQREDNLELAGADIPEANRYEDNDIGASDRSKKPRPDFERMLAYCIIGEIKTVYAYSNSRLTRRPMELELLMRVSERTGVTFVTKVSGSDDLTTADGRMVARIKAAVDAAEAERLGERMARKHLELAQNGKPIGGPRGFGFAENKIDHNPEEAALIRKAADEILSGGSLTRIAQEWHELGVRTVRGGVWRPGTIRGMLRSPRLAGWRTIHGQIALGKDGQPVRGVWRPILDQDTFDRLQVKLDGRARGRNDARRGARQYLLSGLARCGVCNAPMFGGKQRPRDDGTQRHVYACHGTVENRHTVSISGATADALLERDLLQRLETERFDHVPVEFPEQAELDAAIAEIGRLMADMRAKRIRPEFGYPLLEAAAERRDALSAQRAAFMADSAGPDVRELTPERWHSLTDVDKRRAYLEELLTAVLIMPTGKRGGVRSVDPERVVPVWREDDRA